jgi:hypothetical protein
VPQGRVKAIDGEPTTLYFPLLFRPQRVWFDDFQDLDPAWPEMYAKEPGKDGWFEHADGVLKGHIRDNSAMVVVSPGWYANGDYSLEVDARFPQADHKSLNGLGLVFGANEDWSDFYALMLAENPGQHFWVVAHFQVLGPGWVKGTWLTNGGWEGSPGFVHTRDSWNRFKVVREGTTISVYCNDIILDGRPVTTNASYGDGRVGLMFTSYEFDQGEVEFDNFRLTLLDAP